MTAPSMQEHVRGGQIITAALEESLNQLIISAVQNNLGVDPVGQDPSNPKGVSELIPGALRAGQELSADEARTINRFLTVVSRLPERTLEADALLQSLESTSLPTCSVRAVVNAKADAQTRAELGYGMLRIEGRGIGSNHES